MIWKLSASLVAVWLLPAPVSSQNCSCSFRVSPEAELGCHVYGQLGDGVLIAWDRANQTCLDEFNIKVRAIDVDTLALMCPPNATPSVTTMVNFVRFDGASAANRIKANYPAFFESSDGTSYALKDNVMDADGQSLDCQQSASSCWAAFKDAAAADTATLQAVCNQLYLELAKNLELEQSIIRGRLCQESSGTASCEPLYTQVRDTMAENPEKFCSAYELGPANQTIPGACVNDGSPTKSPSTGGSGSGSRSPVAGTATSGECLSLSSNIRNAVVQLAVLVTTWL